MFTRVFGKPKQESSNTVTSLDKLNEVKVGFL